MYLLSALTRLDRFKQLLSLPLSIYLFIYLSIYLFIYLSNSVPL